MDINDDALRALWQRQQPPPGLAATMAGRSSGTAASRPCASPSRSQ